MRTAQEIYETCVKHLRQQGQKSKRSAEKDEYVCLYRDANGHSCAVGCLIPDNEYNPRMEHNDVDGLIYNDLITPARKEEFLQHRILLLELQDIHDNKPINEWEDYWAGLADNLGLRYPQP